MCRARLTGPTTERVAVSAMVNATAKSPGKLLIHDRNRRRLGSVGKAYIVSIEQRRFARR